MKTLINFLKNIITLSLISGLFFNSCKCKKDEKVVPKYRLSGRVFYSCNTPLANYPITLFQSGTSTLTGNTPSHEEMTTTDSLGYFSILFKDNGYGEVIELHCDRNKILGGIPFNKNVNDIVAFKNATACIQLSLNVLNPHTVNDTLNITDLAYFSGLKIPGPLQSGILYTAPSFPLLEPDYNGYDKYIYWSFNKYNGTYNQQILNINKYCNDTIFVTVTIN